ncbi:MAG: GNAT family N-acetyltransferase [Lachnospiraceae bacterium]|nr:GNAT family N-acetyltransferase [Lachnospiraceae bacterium]
MKEQILIRKARVEEAKQIREVKRDGFVEEMRMYGKDPDVFISPEGIAFEKDSIMNADGNQYNFVAEYDEKIIGGCRVIDEGEGQYYIKNIYIGMEWQNKGIGSMLIKFLYGEFADAKRWHLETPYRSYRNHHFYEKLGFKKVGETEPEEDGFYLFQYEYRR